jgi:stage II sporulation protein D
MAAALKLKPILYSVILACGILSAQGEGLCAQPQYIRVAVFENADSLNIKSSGTYEISCGKERKILARGRRLKTTALGHSAGILIQGKNLNCDKVFIRTRDPDTVIINGRTFRGDVELIKNDANKLNAVNFIEPEDYIKGISIREISHYWPPEAIKAAVIVFRTFALYKIEEGISRDFDVTSDIYSQVYSGQAAERYRINKIADQTKGEVLTYKGKILPAFYHATCAGHTEDASLVWNIDIAPLKGVVCDYCKDSPHFKWHYVAALKEPEEKLSSSGKRCAAIKDIVVLGRDASGRITDLKITGSAQELKISAKDFRNIIGPNIIKSTNFNVSIAGPDAVFEGLGWGHGVGMCQWGSYFMAKKGYSAEEILRFYYPGAQILKQ